MKLVFNYLLWHNFVYSWNRSRVALKWVIFIKVLSLSLNLHSIMFLETRHLHTHIVCHLWSLEFVQDNECSFVIDLQNTCVKKINDNGEITSSCHVNRHKISVNDIQTKCLFCLCRKHQSFDADAKLVWNHEYQYYWWLHFDLLSELMILIYQEKGNYK